MEHINWVSPADDAELRSRVTRSWVAVGIYASVSFAGFMSSLITYTRGTAPWLALGLLFTSTAVALLFLHSLRRAIEQSQITREAIGVSESNLKNETTLLLAEIEIELNGK